VANIEDLRIREYQPGDEQGIVNLLNEVFSEDDAHYKPRTLEQWSWIYDQALGDKQIVVAVEPSGRIVGHYACISYPVVIDGAPGRSGQGVDSMVSREYRRGLKSEGLFLRTSTRYFERYGVPEENAYGYGFPNKRAYRIGVKLLHYLPVHAPVPTLGRNLFESSDDSVLDTAGDDAGDDAGEIVELQAFDARVDRLWARLLPEVRMGTVRDAAFLTWRYLDCPFADYFAYGLLDAAGELRGLYVCRENWGGPPIQALTEFLVPDQDGPGALRLLAHAVARARATGQQRVEVWIPPARSLFDLLVAHGFWAEDSPFNLCIKIYGERLDPEWVGRHWYYSIGDTDVF